MESKYYLIIFALILYASYIPLNKRKSRYFWKSKLDFRIPYLSFFIIPYQFFFIFVAATFLLLWNSPFLTSFLLSTIIAELISIIVWFLFPNGVPRTEREEGGLLSKLVNFTYKHDKDTNGFPSGHVFNSLICSHYLALQYPEHTAVILSLAVLIAASTVFVKQHYIVDILGGIVVFLLSVFTIAYL